MIMKVFEIKLKNCANKNLITRLYLHETTPISKKSLPISSQTKITTRHK